LLKICPRFPPRIDTAPAKPEGAAMNGRREGEVLEEILALLVLLAGLADRAAGLPLLLQLPVLGFLTRGEDVARCFIIGLPSGAMAAVVTSHATDRAERLAADLRALARMLRTLLAAARRLARFVTCPAASRAGVMLSHPPACAERPVPALPAPDSS
jgi:hypothetical protein